MDRVGKQVESDYSLVFFASGTTNRPELSWILKTYRGLDRKCLPNNLRYKKNLKKLYIVHASLWTRILLDFMKNVVSPKSKNKFIVIDNLQTLGEFVDIDTCDLPNVVKEVDSKKKKKDLNASKITISDSSTSSTTSVSKKSGTASQRNMFGGNLKYIMSDDIVPPILQEMFSYLIDSGLSTEGIFRKSASASELQEMKARINAKKKVFPVYVKVVVRDHDPIAIAALMKLFFRELEEPLFPLSVYHVLNDMIDKNLSNEDIISIIQHRVLPLLPPENLLLLKSTVDLCFRIQRNSAVNLMTSTNLAVCMTPNLCRHTNVAEEFRTFGAAQIIFKTLIENYESLF